MAERRRGLLKWNGAGLPQEAAPVRATLERFDARLRSQVLIAPGCGLRKRAGEGVDVLDGVQVEQLDG
jgi:hypothetical protein